MGIVGYNLRNLKRPLVRIPPRAWKRTGPRGRVGLLAVSGYKNEFGDVTKAMRWVSFEQEFQQESTNDVHN